MVRGSGPPDLDFVPFAVAGGVAVSVGIGAFFRALAIGTMSVVAFHLSRGSAVPVVYGILLGERPGAGQILGIVLAILGVVLAAREPPKPRGSTVGTMSARAGLAVVAALGFGLFLRGDAQGERERCILGNAGSARHGHGYIRSTADDEAAVVQDGPATYGRTDCHWSVGCDGGRALCCGFIARTGQLDRGYGIAVSDRHRFFWHTSFWGSVWR